MTKQTTAREFRPDETQRERRGHDFYPPADPAIPGLYGTDEQTPTEKVIHVHYFVGGCDWWITELDQTSGEAYGYANLGDPRYAEWGVIYLPELEEIRIHNGMFVVERDLDWTPRTVADANLPGRNAQP